MDEDAEIQARVIACYGSTGCLAAGGGGYGLYCGRCDLIAGGTMLVYLRRACAQPSRVEEIRHLRQAGLAVPRAEE
jgi:hypothetical protein